MEGIYQKIKKIVEKESEWTDAAHDINHTIRVYDLCLKLAKGMGKVDLEVLKLSALLHDIGGAKELRDKSGKTCHAKVSAEMARKILKKFKYPQDKINKIVHCILSHRYKTGIKPETKEAKILFDADKLEGIGAIGVARNFIWVGNNNAKMFAETDLKKYIKENLYGGKKNGRIKDKSKHNPFFEFELKSKLIPKKMHTKKARKMAEERVRYMKSFFDRLKKELKGGI
jgi:uncharacterized protein